MSAIAERGSLENQRSLERRLATRAVDTYSSSSIGGFLYLVAWFPIVLITGMFEKNPVACVATTIAFLLLAILRWQTRPPDQVGPVQQRWLSHYVLVTLSSTVIWSAIQVWIIFDDTIEPMAKSVSIFGTVAFCTAFAHLYTSTLRLSVAGVMILIVPPMVSLWLVPDLRLLAVALTFFAGYLATALSQSQRDYRRRLELADELLAQRDQYELLSRTDELTRLCNRRRFAETLNSAVRKQLALSGPPVNLMLMDIDHFKSINDRHGHIIGDEALKRFAGRMRRAFSEPGMLVARTGGEEFALIASGMSQELAVARADAFRNAMAAEALHIAGLEIPLTVSIGVGLFNAELHRNDDGFYGAVDVALYAAKQRGRNCVVSVDTLEAAHSSAAASMKAQSNAQHQEPESSG